MPEPPEIKRHRTAISRTDLSRPMASAMDAGFIQPGTRVFDYGCGRGDDIRHLEQLEVDVQGWDPVHRPKAKRQAADVVNLGFVVNVIEDPEERDRALEQAWQLAEKILIVSGRLTFDEKLVRKSELADGCLTSRETFQKFYTQSELREWIDGRLGLQSVAAAPGIFFVFRDEMLKQTYLASRYRRRRAAPKLHKSDILYEEHKELLAPLLAFMSDRGRLPVTGELESAPAIAAQFGSVNRAFSVIRRVTGAEQWDAVRCERYQELLIYFALDRLSGRPRFSDLPRDLQVDVRDFFSNYKKACKLADRLLFAAGQEEAVGKAMKLATVGKLMPTALYVHVDFVPLLPPVLRVYEGCARSYLGQVDEANIIKLDRDRSKVAYLTYPNFERDPHPSLADSYSVKLGSLQVRYRSYRESDNPPILHRKEEFVGEEDTSRKKYAKLTAQEERWGLYEDPSTIGHRKQWDVMLQEKGIRLAGHQLRRANPSSDHTNDQAAQAKDET